MKAAHPLRIEPGRRTGLAAHGQSHQLANGCGQTSESASGRASREALYRGCTEGTVTVQDPKAGLKMLELNTPTS